MKQAMLYSINTGIFLSTFVLPSKPVATIGSQLAFPLLLIGLFLGVPSLAQIGVIAFSAAVLFQLVTLPVEYNASSQAIEALEVGGYLSRKKPAYA